MKYFIDTEFIEGFHKPLFGKRRHFIDLISIGIVCEDGRTYQAISKEFRYDDADPWVKENVLMPLYRETVGGDQRNYIGPFEFHKRYGKSNNLIAEEIRNFICNPESHPDLAVVHHLYTEKYRPEFYAYYADYDWVVFCSLFGRMIDLPEGFPMYCRDLKQMLDEYTVKIIKAKASPADIDFDKQLAIIKSDPGYPNDNEHLAIADAKWNFELYKFLQKL